MYPRSGPASAAERRRWTFTVAGAVTLNGGPAEQSCQVAGDLIASVVFEEPTLGYRLTLSGRCAATGPTAAVTFSGASYPGSYKVSVIGYDPNTSNTALPKDGPEVVKSPLAVAGDVSGLVLDVKTFTVAGAVTLNGGPAQQSCQVTGDLIATVLLDEPTLGYHLMLPGRCATTGPTAAVTFGGSVYPGTYKVSVIGYDPNTSNTALPKTGAQVVIGRLQVP